MKEKRSPRPLLTAANIALLLGLTTMLGVSDVLARTLGTFHGWTASTFDEGGETVCMMWSQPTESKGNYTRRGDIYAFVTHRPAAKRNNRISVETGYTYKPDSDVTVAIDGQKFKLFTDSSTAWSVDDKDERKMVNAMRAGSTMVIKGVSSRGTATTDSYSLKGFTAAHKAINSACKIR